MTHDFPRPTTGPGPALRPGYARRHYSYRGTAERPRRDVSEAVGRDRTTDPVVGVRGTETVGTGSGRVPAEAGRPAARAAVAGARPAVALSAVEPGPPLPWPRTALHAGDAVRLVSGRASLPRPGGTPPGSP